MRYNINYDKKATKEQDRILHKIEQLGDNLHGDIKKLTNHTPEYRLRVGDYRVLFEKEGDTIVVYKIKHRKESY